MDPKLQPLEPLLQIVLATIAREIGKKQDDLSVGLAKTVTQFAEACFEAGFEAGIVDVHERPTVTPPPFPAVKSETVLQTNDQRREKQNPQDPSFYKARRSSWPKKS